MMMMLPDCNRLQLPRFCWNLLASLRMIPVMLTLCFSGVVDVGYMMVGEPIDKG